MTAPSMTQPSLLERSRRSASKDAVLARLRVGPVLNDELNRICFRYGARLHELKHQDGYAITKTHLGGGRWQYMLGQG